MRDALGLPEKEPIYAEEHASNPRLQDAPGEPMLQVAPGASQPSAEIADPTPDEVVAASTSRTDVRAEPGRADVHAQSSRTVVRAESSHADVHAESSRTVVRAESSRADVHAQSSRTIARTIGQEPRRITRSQRTEELVALVADSDPRSYREALGCPLHKHWKSAMQEEYASLMENDAFTLVKHTSSKPIGCRWVYKPKHCPDGILRYKARLVVKGYEKVKGIDFDETYAPVGKLTLSAKFRCPERMELRSSRRRHRISQP